MYVGMNNFKQIIGNKFWKHFEYIIEVGIEQENKCVFRKARVYDMIDMIDMMYDFLST